ncbi:hypothetical protein ACFQPG_08205 [Sphingomonas sp. GCM10030256]|uniref:hypothetical protein n=1 Tax=Sphingomonas sp. GCM10030256 TaxID=3273427 RepID=UPI003620306F
MSNEDDRAYLETRIEAEQRLAQQCAGSAAAGVHRRMAEMYRKRLDELTPPPAARAARAEKPDAVAARVAIAKAEFPDCSADYAEARAEAAAQLGNPRASSEWQGAAKRLSSQE